MIHKREVVAIPDKPTLEYEQQLWGEGFQVVAGLDEAGRGAWAGPVFAAAVVLPRDDRVMRLLDGVRDSKRMTAKQRAKYLDCIKSVSVAWTIGSASNEEIDRVGIVPATCLAMERAINELVYNPTYLLVDYIQIAAMRIWLNWIMHTLCMVLRSIRGMAQRNIGQRLTDMAPVQSTACPLNRLSDIIHHIPINPFRCGS